MNFGEHLIAVLVIEAQLPHPVPRSISLISTTAQLHMDIYVNLISEIW